MTTNRIALLLAALMAAASVGAMVARPTVKVSEQGPGVNLETMVPKQFGDWREEPQPVALVVNPQTQQLLDKLYNQILARTYVNGGGYRVMLSLAYGGDQRESLQAHKPEVCYPAQGFVLQRSDEGLIGTDFGAIPVRRLFTTMGLRQEPVTYWYTIGNKAVQSGTQRKLVELSFGLTGRIPDGLLFRISSIDPDQARANRMHDQFIGQLLQAVPPADRLRLSGLGASS